jgi:hypothetical protein
MRKIFLTGILFLCASILKSQDSTSVWRVRGVKSVKLFTSIAYHEGQREIGVGIPLGIGFQTQYFRGRLRVNSSIQAASFRNFAITDVPDNYYRVTTLGIYADFDLFRYYSFSIFLSAGTGLSYSRGMIASWWDVNTGSPISERTFNRWYPLMYAGYGLRIAPRKSRYAIEVFLPPGGHAGQNSFQFHLIRIGVDFRF